MDMNKYMIFISVLFLLLTCCRNDESCDGVLYKRNETYCADPWIAYPHKTDAELENAVMQYLNENQIEACNVNVEFDFTLTEDCLACFCKSGRVITLISASENQAMLEEINFRRAER